MQEKERTFEDENFRVDFITLNIDNLAEDQKEKLAKYFCKLGYNSTVFDKRTGYKNALVEEQRNKYTVQFVTNISRHWKGTSIQFTGINGLYFYKLSQHKQINWEFLKNTKLARLDLCYDLSLDPREEHQEIGKFFEASQKIMRTQKFKYSSHSNLGLELGSKRAWRSGKIYRRSNALRFEVEFKKGAIEAYQQDFIDGSFVRLETELSNKFLEFFKSVLDLRYHYTNWLCQKIRPTHPPFRAKLCSDYMVPTSQKLSKSAASNFVMLLKLLSFIKELPYKRITFDELQYRVVEFRIAEFADVCGALFHSNKTNAAKLSAYRVQRIKPFLLNVQFSTFLEVFNDSPFIQGVGLQDRSFHATDSISAVHRVTIYKPLGSNFVHARLVILNSIIEYDYPFLLPDLFEQRLSKLEQSARILVVQTYCSKNPQKILDVGQFFRKNICSNEDRASFKKEVIFVLRQLEKTRVIQSKILLNNSNKFVELAVLSTPSMNGPITFYEDAFVNTIILS